MKKVYLSIIGISLACQAGMAQTSSRDTLSLTNQIHQIDEVVVTGARQETDVRHLSQTVSVVGRAQIEHSLQSSLLPVLTEQVPGLFVTSRGVMGYGVSNGAAGSISLRGLSGGTARLMVLIDGHPQYAGIFGHPIADAYQSFLAERVEVLRGPASVLYGSNAMGGVINIVTRRMQEDGVNTHLHVGYGSYNTLETELTNRVRKGRFSQTDPVVTEDFVLWNVRASFRATHWLDIWARGENLLAQRYEINAGYPMPRTTVIAGVNLNF